MITDTIVYQYIQWADEKINADLSAMYVIPINPQGNYEATMLSDIDNHNPNIILSQQENIFNIGDDIVITDGTHEEMHYIEAITDGSVIETHDVISYHFAADDTRIIRVAYPFPITLCSSRIAAANIYDKYFSSQSDPGTSDYGKFLREQALQDMNSVLNGRIILNGARKTNRFWNPNLSSGIGWPAQMSDLPKRDISELQH
jgi:hypothetical protein